MAAGRLPILAMLTLAVAPSLRLRAGIAVDRAVKIG
jgi:hypothetical protein